MELAGPAPVVGQAPTLTLAYLGNRAMTIAVAIRSGII